MKTTQKKKRKESVHTHISHDTISGEVHVDLVNIDFLRYYTWLSFGGNLAGTTLMMMLWMYIPNISQFAFSYSVTQIVLTNIMGAMLFFILGMSICVHAGNSLVGSARITGRRGLFAYVIMSIVIVLFLILTGEITLNGLFGETLHRILFLQIFCAFLGVVLDYVLPLFTHHPDTKRGVSIRS